MTALLIEPSHTTSLSSVDLPSDGQSATTLFLVRYGLVPEVARFVDESGEVVSRQDDVVVETHRGLQTGSVLERLKPNSGPPQDEVEFRIVRRMTDEDREASRSLMAECDEAFSEWCQRIQQWELQLELIDLEWTLDRNKLILYVLCDRGPDTTKLALQAAAAGLGIIEVQPVTAAGLVPISAPEGGCGSGGGGCGCSH